MIGNWQFIMVDLNNNFQIKSWGCKKKPKTKDFDDGWKIPFISSRWRHWIRMIPTASCVYIWWRLIRKIRCLNCKLLFFQGKAGLFFLFGLSLINCFPSLLKPWFFSLHRMNPQENNIIIRNASTHIGERGQLSAGSTVSWLRFFF